MNHVLIYLWTVYNKIINLERRNRHEYKRFNLRSCSLHESILCYCIIEQFKDILVSVTMAPSSLPQCHCSYIYIYHIILLYIVTSLGLASMLTAPLQYEVCYCGYDRVRAVVPCGFQSAGSGCVTSGERGGGAGRRSGCMWCCWNPTEQRNTVRTLQNTVKTLRNNRTLLEPYRTL